MISVTVQSQPQKLAFFRCGVSAKYIFTAKRSRMQAFITSNCKNMLGSEQLQTNNLKKYADKSYNKVIYIQTDLDIHIIKEERIMSNISSMADSMAAYSNYNTNHTEKSDKGSKTQSTDTKVKSKVNGKTIGNPELSEKASKYYEELKNKYSNMDFILVSKDMKEQAKAQAGSYANADKMVVLIDEDKIEKMAEDEKYRKQYEGIIANAASGMSQLGKSLSETGANVKGYGIQINDNGTASYFAVLEKSTAAQKERIEKKAEEKREAKKAEAKKAEKEQWEERLHKSKDKTEKTQDKDEDTVTITGNSIEELIKKIQDNIMEYMSDNVQTESEKQVGQKFDFSV